MKINPRALLASLAIPIVTLAVAAPARADYPSDPGTTQEVCGAYNLGVPQDQIAQGLQRNDARMNEWRAWHSTNWPIIEGDCG